MVKLGYKQTEIGIFPEDWDVLTMDKLTTLMTNGFVGTIKCEYVPSGTGILYLQGFNVKENRFDLTGVTYVSKEFHQKHLKSELKENDLLTVQTGNIGVTAVVPKEYQGANCQALIISRFHACYDSRYWSYYFNSVGRKSLIEIETGSTMKHINVGDLKNVYVPVPATKTEQGAIAAALSDIDALIANLEKLITKKKAIKQGTMQELLTGKRRLPGFDEEWMDSSIGDICELVSGGTPSTSVAEYWDGDIPWCTPTDITSCNGKYLYKTVDSITILGLANSSATMLPEGALLLCTRATIGAVKITAIPICTNQGFKALVVRDCADNEWLYYAIQMLKKEMVSQAIGSTFLEISRKALANIHIKLPSKEEQKAIAGILSDMDSEICELEQKYRKYCLIKQGMMSELLTGRIRLIDKEDA